MNKIIVLMYFNTVKIEECGYRLFFFKPVAVILRKSILNCMGPYVDLRSIVIIKMSYSHNAIKVKAFHAITRCLSLY